MFQRKMSQSLRREWKCSGVPQHQWTAFHGSECARVAGREGEVCEVFWAECIGPSTVWDWNRKVERWEAGHLAIGLREEILDVMR